MTGPLTTTPSPLITPNSDIYELDYWFQAEYTSSALTRSVYLDFELTVVAGLTSQIELCRKRRPGNSAMKREYALSLNIRPLKDGVFLAVYIVAGRSVTCNTLKGSICLWLTCQFIQKDCFRLNQNSEKQALNIFLVIAF